MVSLSVPALSAGSAGPAAQGARQEAFLAELLVMGLAAQRILGNLIAGLQIAFAEPMNIDDVMIIEGEWGRIQEITATYVVVRIWDDRRLIVPFSHFIEKPLQHWTRRTSQILGTVTICADYTVPVEAVRAELQRIVEASPLWDKRVAGLQVTDCSERAVALRALISAAGASQSWDLRCLVRERLVDVLQRTHPQYLPVVRAASGTPPTDPVTAAA